MAVQKSELVDPEIFMKYKGVAVYHCYKNDCMDSGPRFFIYTVDKEDGGDCHNYFDVRQLPFLKHVKIPLIDIATIRAAIRDAIDQGLDLLSKRYE